MRLARLRQSIKKMKTRLKPITEDECLIEEYERHVFPDIEEDFGSDEERLERLSKHRHQLQPNW